MKNLFTKILACCLAVCMVFTLCISALTVSAEDVVYDGTLAIGEANVEAGATEATVSFNALAEKDGIAAANVKVNLPTGATGISKVELETEDENVEVTFFKDATGDEPVVLPGEPEEDNGEDVLVYEGNVNIIDNVFSYILWVKSYNADVTKVAVNVKITFVGTFNETTTVTADIEACKDSVDLLNLETVPGAINVDAHECVPGEPVIENQVAATCTTDGSYDTVIYCTVCEEEVSRTPGVYTAEGHKNAEAVIENEVPATCLAAGSYDTVVYCTVCKAEISRETLPIEKLEHVFGDNLEFCANNCGTKNPDYVAPCEHTYEYIYTTENDNYITRKKCNGTCGYNEVVSTISKSTTRTFATILPENDLSLLYRFAKASVDNYSNLELEVKKQVFDKGATGSYITTTILTEHNSMKTSQNVECEEFKFSNIAAYEVMNTVAVRLFGINANGDRVFIREVPSYSVYSYINSQMKSASTTTQLKDALVDLLEYAGTTQVLLDFNTENLANSDKNLLPTWKEAGYGTDKSEYPTKKSDLLTVTASQKNETEVGSISFNMSLEPLEKVYIIYNINETPKSLPKFSGDRSNLYLKLDYHNTDGGISSETYDFSEMKYNDSTGRYYVSFGLAPIAMMDYPVSGAIYYGDPESEGSYVISTIVYSIESYIAGQIENPNATAELKANLKAMYAYSRTNAIVAKIDRYVSK